MRQFHLLLFFGLLLVFINLYINDIAVLFKPIGYIIIIIAFFNVKEKYANIGAIAASICFIFSISNYLQPFSLETSLAAEVSSVILWASSMFVYFCVFAVSNEIIPLKSRLLPKVLFSTLIGIELMLIFAPFLDEAISKSILLVLLLILILAYVAMLIFLLERQKLVKRLLQEK